MVKNDNPAGRLHRILEDAQAGTGNGYLLWAKVFDIPVVGDKVSEEVEMEVFYRIVQLRRLISEAEDSLRKIEGLDLELYLRPFPRIREAIRINFLQTSNYEVVLQRITEGDMTVLALGARELSKWQPENTVEEDQIRELLEDIQSLYEEVLASELKDELKTLILDQLELIRRALHEYRVRGIKRLSEALTTVVGAYLLNKDLLDQEGEKEEVTKFKGTLNKFASIVAFASHTTNLIATYLPKLLPGG